MYMTPVDAAKMNEPGVLNPGLGKQRAKGYKRGPGGRKTQRRGKLFSPWREGGKLPESSGI